jgi:hypothetical protein
VLHPKIRSKPFKSILLNREALNLPINVNYSTETQEQIATLILSNTTSIITYEKIKAGIRTSEISTISIRN